MDQNANTEASGEADADFDMDINVHDDNKDEQDNNIPVECYDLIDNLSDNEGELYASENEDLTE